MMFLRCFPVVLWFLLVWGDESSDPGGSASVSLVLISPNGKIGEISWQEMKMESQYFFESRQFRSKWSIFKGSDGR